MPINKIVTDFDEAVQDIFDGAVIMVGGFGTVVSMPSCLLEAVYRKGVKDLTTADPNLDPDTTISGMSGGGSIINVGPNRV